jgi:hypothetical protein
MVLSPEGEAVVGYFDVGIKWIASSPDYWNVRIEFCSALYRWTKLQNPQNVADNPKLIDAISFTIAKPNRDLYSKTSSFLKTILRFAIRQRFIIRQKKQANHLAKSQFKR